MKKLLVIWLLIIPALLQADTVYTFVFKEGMQARYDLSDLVDRMVDTTGRITIEEILTSRDLQGRFKPIDNLGKETSLDAVVWSRAVFLNISKRPVDYLLSLSNADSLAVFKVNQGKITKDVLGKKIPIQQKTFKSHLDHVRVVLNPGESDTFYIRASGDQFYDILPGTSVQLIQESRWRLVQYLSIFTSGIQVLMLGLCLLLFFIFKDRQYLLFILPLTGFLIWFSYRTDIHIIFNTFPVLTKYQPVLTGWYMPLTVAVFFLGYVGIRKKLKWVYYTLWVLILATVGVSLLSLLVLHYSNNMVNSLVLIFMLVGYGSGTYLAFRGDRKAFVWLLFTAPLFITGLLYLIDDLFLSINLDVVSLMQIGALASSLIIGYMMYDRVNKTIRDNINISRTNERLVREQNVILEQKVSERTRELAAEKQKSDSILLNILPEEVAEELKETGRSQARLFEKVTVLFTDFVDFTKAGERLTAQALVSELHNCFKAFDEIIQKHGLEKIKTVGDAYIAVAGLPVSVKDHAERTAKAALDIREFMSARHHQLGEKTFKIRLGIHSGSVVAGIVGVKKFAYDIWGDTVNTAARMEQNSKAGRVNISQSTYGLIKDSFECTPRGKVAAKNKGMMEMYFLNAAIDIKSEISFPQ
ncbi:MAG: adenylate/guanylate cyclase domain-containing protein [Bacteroidia bacterium]